MDYDNQYNTSYGAKGGNDGGGFMPGDVSGSQGGGKGDYAKDTVRPVTIKQLLDAEEPYPEAGFQVSGAPISHVTFIGQIRNVAPQTTNVTYRLDDGTGIIEAKQWIDAGDAGIGDEMETDSSAKSKLVDNVYCRVWGKLKAFNNKKHVGAHVIRPVTDYNEISYHLLEATAVHLFFTKGPSPLSKGHNGVKKNEDDAGGATSSSMGRQLPLMTPAARRIYETLSTSTQSNEGINLHVLAQQLHLDIPTTQNAAQELIGMSLIFTTLDETTYALLQD